jgi:hypothetical protein
VICEPRHVVGEEVGNDHLEGWVGQMNRLRTIEFLYALGELIGLPGALKIVGESRNDLLTEASDIVLVGNDEDVHAEDQTFLERAGLFLVIRQVVDVSDHGMDSFDVIVVSEVNLVTCSNLIQKLVRTSEVRADNELESGR